MSTRLIVGVVAVVMLVGGLGLIALRAAFAPSGFWLTVFGAAVLVTLAIERNRYRSEEADRTFEPIGPGGGEPSAELDRRFRPTEETFVDPTSGHTMRVYLDRRTGERRYVSEA